MNAKLLLPLVPLAALVLAPEPEELVLQHVADRTLRYTFEQKTEIELSAMTGSMKHAGEEREMPSPEVEIEMSIVENLVFTDRLVSVADDRVTELHRTFDELGHSRAMEITHPGGSQSDDQESESALEGKSVVFEWNEEGDDYDVRFDGEGDEELLEFLEIDVDFAGFLPGKAVSEGDTWDAPASAMRYLLLPGGDLHFQREGEDAESTMERQLVDNLEGEIHCRFTGVREEEGRRLGVVVLEVDVRTHAAEDEELEANGMTGTASQSSEAVVDVTGELVWDLGAGRAATLALEGDFELVTDVVQAFPEGDFERTQHQEFTGTVSFAVAVE